MEYFSNLVRIIVIRRGMQSVLINAKGMFILLVPSYLTLKKKSKSAISEPIKLLLTLF